MWRAVQPLLHASSLYGESAKNLTQVTMRSIIVTTGIIYLAWHVISTLNWLDEIGPRVWLVTAAFVLVYLLTLYCLPHHFIIAHVIFQFGLTGITVLSSLIFKQPFIAFFLAILPLTAVVVIGWPAGLLAEVIVSAIAYGLEQSPYLRPIPTLFAAQIASVSGIMGLVGWASSKHLYTVAQWSSFALEAAQRNMAEAREHRAQLARVVKDLDQAYYRLGRANAALVAAWRVADEAERTRAEFATNLSHELRTPLSLIIGFSEMMMTAQENYGSPLPVPYRADLSTIYRNARHLLALTNDVLDLARIDAAKIILARDDVDLGELVAEVTHMVNDYVVAKGLELRVRVEGGLSNLWIDRLRIRQVLLNLLVNAVRFTQRGWIEISVARRGDEVVVQVKDTGQGISSEQLPRIFDGFHTETPKSEGWPTGTGLGLPISRKLVELHHGIMGVDSTYMQGTILWFTLPIETSSNPQPTFTRLKRMHPPERVKISERIVVAAYDDPRTRAMLRRHLGGYRVLDATTVSDGIRQAMETNALALLTDAEIPPDSQAGLTYVHCVLPSMRRKAEGMGASELLLKPVSSEELWAAISYVGSLPRQVLIVDDDLEMVRLLRGMLQPGLPAGKCLEAHDGEAALHLMRTEQVDLVLLDLIMPGMSGQTVLKEMRANPELASIPVIVISAKGEEELDLRISDAIQVSRAEGLALGDIIRTLRATIDALVPALHKTDSMERAR